MPNSLKEILLTCGTKATLEAKIAAGKIKPYMLVFISETHQIYMDGQYYGGADAVEAWAYKDVASTANLDSLKAGHTRYTFAEGLPLQNSPVGESSLGDTLLSFGNIQFYDCADGRTFFRVSYGSWSQVSYSVTEIESFLSTKIDKASIAQNFDSPSANDVPSTKAVADAIDSLGKSVVYKGTLGTGGDIQTLPAPSAANEQWQYTVITPGTYAGKQAVVGESFICIESNGSYSWSKIPSAAGTVTSVNATGNSGISVTGGPITSAGTLVIDVDSLHTIPTIDWTSQVDNHMVSATLHLTPEQAQLIHDAEAHMLDSEIHVTAEDKARWDETTPIDTSWPATLLDTHIPSTKLVKNSLDGKADKDHAHPEYETQTHASETYETVVHAAATYETKENVAAHTSNDDIHVTAEDKARWDEVATYDASWPANPSDASAPSTKLVKNSLAGKANVDHTHPEYETISHAAATYETKENVAAHTSNTEIHVTAEDKARWDETATYDTSWPANPSDTSAPSTKLVKNSLAGKADIDHTHPEYLTEEKADTLYADIDHTHDEYAEKDHTHPEYLTEEKADTLYAEIDHTHDGYAEKDHTHPEYLTETKADTLYADIDHTHDEYALKDHTHAEYLTEEKADTLYADIDHTHSEYLTETKADTLYADITHTHDEYLTEEEADKLYSDINHTHDEYLTEEEADKLYADIDHTHEEYITSIKTINGQSLIGTGNIKIEGGGSSVTVDTSWPANPSDDNVPSTKLVKNSLAGKADTGHTHSEYETVAHAASTYETKTNVAAHTSNTDIHVTLEDKARWDETITLDTSWPANPSDASAPSTKLVKNSLAGKADVDHTHSEYETSAHAAATYETVSHASSTYQTKADPTITVETGETVPTVVGALNTIPLKVDKSSIKQTLASPNDADIPSTKAVADAIDSIGKSIVYKGTLGTGGDIQTLPSPSASNEQWEYVVVSAGTYAGQTANVGDAFICVESNGSYSWSKVPGAPGTVTSVSGAGSSGLTLTGGPITSAGTLTVGVDSLHAIPTTSWKASVDTHLANTEIHVTAEDKARWDEVATYDASWPANPSDASAPSTKLVKNSLAGKADVDHTHDEYAAKDHTHSEYLTETKADTLYADIDHTHPEYLTETKADTLYADIDHTHDEYAAKDHTHSEYLTETKADTLYADKDHTHPEYLTEEKADTLYADVDHTHDEYAAKNHTHSEYLTETKADTLYADINHTHDEYLTEEEADTLYADINHAHSEYALKDHTHSEYLTEAKADTLYADKDHTHSQYLTEAKADTLYADITHTHSEYETTSHASSTYETKTHASSTYQTKADVAITVETGESTPTVVGALNTIPSKVDKASVKQTLASPNTTDIPSTKAVADAIESIGKSVVYKGTLGTGGDIQTLPSPSASNEQWEYVVVSAGTYAGQSANVGDAFICVESGGSYSWSKVPGAPGTVTSVSGAGSSGLTLTGGPITSAGTLTVGVDSSHTIPTKTWKTSVDTHMSNTEIHVTAEDKARWDTPATYDTSWPANPSDASAPSTKLVKTSLAGKSDVGHTHSEYETTSHASSTYETKTHASSTYETKTNVTAHTSNTEIHVTAEDKARWDTPVTYDASWPANPSDASAPSTKLVKNSLAGKADTNHTHSEYETTSHASSTYETKTHASSTYETKTHASSTYETKENVAAHTSNTDIHVTLEDKARWDETIPIDTSWPAKPSDSNVPSTKLVKAALDTKANTGHTHSNYETIAHAEATYETVDHAEATYETQTHATATFQPKGDYITSVKTINGKSIVGTGNITIESGSTVTIDTAWPASTSDANVPSTKLVKASLDKCATQTWVEGKGYTTNEGTITGVSVHGTSVATSGVANLTNVAVIRSIANGTDLDTLKTPGYYNAAGNHSCTHAVSTENPFGLEVIHSASGEYYTQIWYDYFGRVYRRFCKAGTWTDWMECVADWNETSVTSPGFIKNKPTKLSQFSNDQSFITTADLSGYATQTWVTGQGYTKNAGTITGVSVHGTSVATSGVANLTNVAVIRNIANGTDLNTLKTPGYYNAGGSHSCVHAVSTVNAFGLEVIHTAGSEYYTQIWYDYFGRVYRRFCKAGTWTDWMECVADWSETSVTSPGFIKNKPTKLSQFSNDSGYITSGDLSDYAKKSDLPVNVSDLTNDAYYGVAPYMFKINGTDVTRVANGAPPVTVLPTAAYDSDYKEYNITITGIPVHAVHASMQNENMNLNYRYRVNYCFTNATDTGYVVHVQTQYLANASADWQTGQYAMALILTIF